MENLMAFHCSTTSEQRQDSCSYREVQQTPTVFSSSQWPDVCSVPVAPLTLLVFHLKAESQALDTEDRRCLGGRCFVIFSS
eukprot:4694083-Amphidinium_carterae.1